MIKIKRSQKRTFVLVVSYAFFAFLLVLFSAILPQYLNAEGPRQGIKATSTEIDEYEFLHSLYLEGAFNYDILVRLSELAPKEQLSLAYLRQAKILKPSADGISRLIDQKRQKLSVSFNSTSNHIRNDSYSYYLMLPNFIPFYILDYLFLSFSALSLIMLYLMFKNSNAKRVYFVSFAIGFSLILFFQKIFLTYSPNGELRLIKDFSELNKKEGVILLERSAFAAPTDSAQETLILKPGAEISILPQDQNLFTSFLDNSYSKDEKSKKGSILESELQWIRVTQNDGRSGWLKGTDSIFILRR